MTDDRGGSAHPAQHFAALADAAGGRRLGADPQPGDARRATSATGRRPRTPRRRCSSSGRSSSPRARRHAARSRSTTSSCAPASRRWRRTRWSPRSSCRFPAARAGSVHVRRTRRRGHDLASVTLACSVDGGGTTRIAYGSVGPRPVLVIGRERPPRRPGRAVDGEGRRLRAHVRGRQPVAPLDAGEPRLPSRDAARAGCARGRRGEPPAGGGMSDMIEPFPIRVTVNGRARTVDVATAPHPARRRCATTCGSPAPRSAASWASAAPAPSSSTAAPWTRASCSRWRPTGREVTTVEGLATTDGLSPLQQAFLDTGAAQCGFCIPGQLVAAHAFLRDDAASHARGRRGGDRRQPVPVRRLRADPRRDHGRRRRRASDERVDHRHVAEPRRRHRPRHRPDRVRRRPPPAGRAPRQARHARLRAGPDRLDRRERRAGAAGRAARA